MYKRKNLPRINEAGLKLEVETILRRQSARVAGPLSSAGEKKKIKIVGGKSKGIKGRYPSRHEKPPSNREKE